MDGKLYLSWNQGSRKSRSGDLRRSRVLVVVLGLDALLVVAVVAGLAFHVLPADSSVFCAVPEVVFQPGTAGTSTIYVNSTAASTSVSAYRPWWNETYGFRRRLTIRNDAASDLPEGYSVCLVLDTSSFVSSGKMKADGGDLRILYWNGTWVELDRDLVSMNTSATQVWFRTLQPVASNSSDTSYWMYYGNPDAGVAPSNRSKVYLLYDDFSQNTLGRYDLAKWVDIHGGPTLYKPPSYDETNARVTFDTGDNYASDMYPKGINVSDFLVRVNFWADLNYPYDATIALIGRLQNPGTASTHYYLDFSHGRYDSPGITVDSWINGERSNTVYSEPSDYYWSFGTVHTFVYAIFGTTHKFWWNKNITQSPDVVAEDSMHMGPGRVGISAAQVRGWWDNLMIRRYVEPEPVVTAEEEETRLIRYDFVLRVRNSGSRLRQARLRVYSQENVGRIVYLDIAIREGTDEISQIMMLQGSYVRTYGDWVSLDPSETVYLVVTVLADPGDLSTIRAYLEVLVPGTTTRDLLTVKFQFT